MFSINYCIDYHFINNYEFITNYTFINNYILIISTHASNSALMSYVLPLIGITIIERLRDRGIDSIICYDDFSKHSKSYRQISLILNKIPSRDAFPSNIFNIHASILERSGKLKLDYFNGSITALPIIETINNDITEFIATNIISITDRQLYTNKKLFINNIRPCIDSALSVSRIGSNAQYKIIKLISIGLKNELTNYRIIELSSSSDSSIIKHKLIILNSIYYQDHLYISSIEFMCILIILYRNLGLFNLSCSSIFSSSLSFYSYFDIILLCYYFNYDCFYFYYLLFLFKSTYSLSCYYLVISLLLMI